MGRNARAQGAALGRGFYEKMQALKGRNSQRHLALSGLIALTSSDSQGDAALALGSRILPFQGSQRQQALFPADAKRDRESVIHPMAKYNA